jgi:hypothetical protein
MILEWTHPKESPGVFTKHLNGHSLRIVPIGSSEWDGLVDGNVVAGSDDPDIVEQDIILYFFGHGMHLSPMGKLFVAESLLRA